jgi:hypothetical protein
MARASGAKVECHNVYRRVLRSLYCLWPVLIPTLETSLCTHTPRDRTSRVDSTWWGHCSLTDTWVHHGSTWQRDAEVQGYEQPCVRKVACEGEYSSACGVDVAEWGNPRIISPRSALMLTILPLHLVHGLVTSIYPKDYGMRGHHAYLYFSARFGLGHFYSISLASNFIVNIRQFSRCRAFFRHNLFGYFLCIVLDSLNVLFSLTTYSWCGVFLSCVIFFFSRCHRSTHILLPWASFTVIFLCYDFFCLLILSRSLWVSFFDWL